MSSVATLAGVEVLGQAQAGFSTVLTPDALGFVASLQRTFVEERKRLLAARDRRQALFDLGALPEFPPETQEIRDSDWTIGRIPDDLVDRRVEITGPAGDPKMLINALNSGASTYMADFEDSQSPTWAETVKGQLNLKEAVSGEIRHVTPEGKVYLLNRRVATLIVRPRGLHLEERHVLVDGEPISASFFDIGLFLYHNAETLRKKGSGPYFYIPKVESYLEARLWEKAFSRAEDYLGLERNTVKLTFLIETLPAAFEMDEILYETRGRVVGLNCGRWDYIFSYIKKLRNHPQFVLPDRALLTMDGGFLAPYVDAVIKTCHRRRAYAIGGMSAYIPVKGDEAANEAALQKVAADKRRECSLGHEGTWVAHPGLVRVARVAFSEMNGQNQLGMRRDDVDVKAVDLIRVPEGKITRGGLVANVSVGLRYLESWLGGRGCVPINNLMEDAATTEICRAQLWQWVRYRALLEDGTPITKDMVTRLISAQAASLSEGRNPDDAARAALAGRMFAQMVVADNFPEFITIPAYEELIVLEANAR